MSDDHPQVLGTGQECDHQPGDQEAVAGLQGAHQQTQRADHPGERVKHRVLR